MSQTFNGSSRNYSYTYDKNGNILSVTDANGTTTYEYDSQGQLLRENNQAGNFTHMWEYDDAGNILSRKEYAYTTETISNDTAYVDRVEYNYGGENEVWGDLLTSYDGIPISYDMIGNPLDDGTWTYSWQHGRQLASMTDGETTWNYTYNADGLRTKRTNGSKTYKYVYHDGLLQYMEYNTLIYVQFTHAPDGTPVGMRVNSQMYYYITNLQGDVVGIVDTNGNLLVSYAYDAWGNTLSVIKDTSNINSSAIATLNPFRYRGYVYDAETGLYYLQSRYYNSNVGRFINSDGYTSTGQGFGGNNMFAYCGNLPIGRRDSSGQGWEDLWEFLKTAANEISQTIEALAPVYTTGTLATVADGPLPAVDAAVLVGLTVVTAYAVGEGLVQTIQDFSSREKMNSSELAVTQSFARGISNPGDRYVVHHIVAQNDHRAAAARSVLKSVDINPAKSGLNLAVIPESKHSSMHSNSYYSYIDLRFRGLENNETAVMITLFELQIEIQIYCQTGWKVW